MIVLGAFLLGALVALAGVGLGTKLAGARSVSSWGRSAPSPSSAPSTPRGPQGRPLL